MHEKKKINKNDTMLFSTKRGLSKNLAKKNIHLQIVFFYLMTRKPSIKTLITKILFRKVELASRKAALFNRFILLIVINKYLLILVCKMS